jgi:hypothetical protein
VNPYPTVLDLAKRVKVLEEQQAWLMQNAVVGGSGDREEQQFPPEARIYTKPTADEIRQMVCQHANTYRKQTHTTGIPPKLASDITYCSDCGAIVQNHRTKPVKDGAAADSSGRTYTRMTDGSLRENVATPPADDAAGYAIRCLLDDCNMTKGTEHCAILAAIRAGKVPGIWCGELAENIASAQLVKGLRTQLAEATAMIETTVAQEKEARAEVAALKGKLSDSYAIVADIERHTEVCGDGVGRFIRDRIASFKAHQALAAKDAK